MDVKDLPEVSPEDPVVVPEAPAGEEVEDVPAIAVHPLAVAVRQLEILQNQIFLAGPMSSIQAQSRENQPSVTEDSGPYCRLACDVLSCAVSACELWRESLLRHQVASAMGPCPLLSMTELSRLLSKLLASLHILDCLKDSKQAFRDALAGVTAQEGDEQQLLAAVQDFFEMPTACLVLLRDMLLEDTIAISRTKQALLRLLPIQLEVVEMGHASGGQEGERKRGLKSKLGLSGSSSHANGDGCSGTADGTISARSTARIALSLLVYLYCFVDSAEQEQLAQYQTTDGATPPGAKASGAAAHKLIRSCVATLRATPVVPGYGDVPVDLLRPLQGLKQLSLSPAWESLPTSTMHLATAANASEERYNLSAASAAAAQDFGRLVEDLLTLKLQVEAERRRSSDDMNSSSSGGSGTGPAVHFAPADAKTAGTEVPRVPSAQSQAALSRAAGAIAGRAMQLLQDWQAAVLQLDAFRTWQRRQRQEDEAARDAAVAGGNDGVPPPDQTSKATLPRCAFTTADIPDVVRMVSYIKGLHGIVTENLEWLEPLLRLHCAAHLAQLLASVVMPVAQGALGVTPSTVATTAPLPPTGMSVNAQQRQPLPPAMAMSIDGHPISAPSTARGTGTCSIFASNPPSACTGAPGGGTAAAAAAEAAAEAAAAEAAAAATMTIGRMWKAKVKHGRSHSTASSLEVIAPDPRQISTNVPAPNTTNPPATATTTTAGAQAENAANGPSQRTTEDSADTGNLIASITADGIDWATGRPMEFRTDPYARLREWFVNGGTNVGSIAPSIQTGPHPPLTSVPEGNTPRSERSPVAATVTSAGRRCIVTPSAVEVGITANSPSVQRGGGSCSSAQAEHHWGNGSSTRMPGTTATDGTEDGVECTVSSVSDCEGLMAALDSDEDEDGACKSGHVGVDMDPNETAQDIATAEEAEPETPTLKPQPTPQHPQSAQQPQSASQPPLLQQQASWPAAELLWPPPPVPSASWLAGTNVSPGNTVSAGGALTGQTTSRSPGSGLPRMTAPAALSTNPLYIYPSAAREAVAEQERATVAIWMASEGGAAMPPPLPGLEQPAGSGQDGQSASVGEVHNGAVQQQRQHQVRQGHDSQPIPSFGGGIRGYCDDTRSTVPMDQQQSCYVEEVTGVSAQLDTVMTRQTGYSEIAPLPYCPEINVSHNQLDPSMMHPPLAPGYGRESLDGNQGQPQQHSSNTQPNHAHKKFVSSPFKRIKKLFSKRDRVSGPNTAGASLGAGQSTFDDPAATTFMLDPSLDSFYNAGGVDFPATGAGFGALPAPYLAEPREYMASYEADAADPALYGAYGLGRPPPGLPGDYLPGIMAEATSHDGAVAVLSVGPAGPLQPGAPAEQHHMASMLGPLPPGLEPDVQGAAGPIALGGIRTSKVRMVSGGGTVKGSTSAAAFLEIACRARDEYSCQRLRLFANDMQICLATAGFMAGADGVPRPSAGADDLSGKATARALRKVASAGARASLKKLVTSFKVRTGGRQRSAGGDAGGSDQDVPFWACDAAQCFGLDAQALARLRNAAELMVQELEAMIAQRRARGKSTKDGPSLMQLLALISELRTFLQTILPSVEPLLSFRVNLAAAADLSSLLVLDPSRSYAAVPGNGLGADARGSVPWELANKGVLVNAGPEGAGGMGAPEMPLAAGLTVLTLFKDAVEAVQMQQAHAAATGYPEAPTAARLQQLYRRQAKWCLTTFVQMAARKVWGTYKAQAVRSKLGLAIPAGAPDVSATTSAFEGLFRPARDDPLQQQLLMLASCRPDLELEAAELGITDQLAAAIDDLVRQSAARAAELLLGSDLTSLVAVKQQVDTLSLAVSRLRRELPAIRPWNDAWLAALAACAASSPTCTAIADTAAATAAAVTQGCSSGASGLTLSVEDIILTHACSIAALRTLSTWSYDMTAVRFRPTKHTKTIWEGLVGSAAHRETVGPLLFPDGADIALANVTADSPSTSARSTAPTAESSTAIFTRAHVQALHGLLGLDGVARWVTALRRHACELLADAAPLLRRVHELYDSSLAGPRGPGMREAGGASGYLQLQQRWLRDRGHSELLVSAHRAMQALGNTIAVVALIDSVLAELCVARAPHLLPLAASSLQADQQAHAALKAVAMAGLVKPTAPVVVPAPPRGAGLAGLLLGQPLPPGLMTSTQSAVQAASAVQDRLQEQLPPAFGLPGLWRALHECLQPSSASGPRQEQLFNATRLWAVVQVQLSCLSPEEQVIHTANVGDGVYVSAAALVQLASGMAMTPGSVLNGDTMTALQQSVTLEQLKADLAAATAGITYHPGSATPALPSAPVEKATLEQLKAWAARADTVRCAWDRAVQLTVGAGTVASKLVASSGAPRSSRPDIPPGPRVALDSPALTPGTAEPWAALAQQAAAAGTSMLIRAAAAAAAPPPQHVPAPQPPVVTPSQAGGGAGAVVGGSGGAGAAPGSRVPTAANSQQGRSSSHQGISSLNQTMPNPLRVGPPRPPSTAVQQQTFVSAAGVTVQHRASINGPPLPPRIVTTGPSGQYGRSLTGVPGEAPLQQHPQQQQQALQTLRAASQVLMRSPRGEGASLGAYGLFTIAGSTAAQSRSRAASSLGDWGHME